jgi:multiple sugar transport system substrate-binding protein
MRDDAEKPAAISRRDLLRLGAAAGGAALISGCSKTKTAGGPSGGTAAPSGGGSGPVTLNYMSHPGQILPIIKSQMGYLKEKHGINVRIVEAPDGTSYQEAMKDHRAGGGRYDILMHFPRFNGDLTSSGCLLPLDDLITKHNAQPLFDGIEDAYRILYTQWGGKTIGVPVDGDVGMMYYRKDAFENPEHQKKFKAKYGTDLKVPRTWEECLRAAEFFTGWAWGPTGKPGYGFQTSTWARGFIEQQWAPMMASAGGNWFTPDLKPAWSGEPGVRALQDLKTLLGYAPPGSVSLSWDQTMETIFANDVAISLWYMDLGRLGWAKDSWFAKSGGPDKMKNIGYALWPGYEVSGQYRNFNSMFYGRVLGISSHSKHPDQAFQLLQTMLMPERQILFVDDAQSGADQSLKAHYDPAAYKKLTPTAEYLAAAKQVINNGFPEMQLPGAGEYMDTLQGALHGYLAGSQTDAGAALKQAADRWEEITERWDRNKQKEYWAEILGRYKQAGLKIAEV